MAILIYALQSFTATDGTACVANNSYSLSESAANIAVNNGQAQLAQIPPNYGLTELPQAAHFATLSSAQAARPDITGVVASTESGDMVGPDGPVKYAKVRTTPLRDVSFGDSIAAYINLPTAVNNQYVEKTSVPFPASGANSIAKVKNRFLSQDLYPKLVTVGNCGISGQTTTQMLARETASYSVTRRAVADVVSLQPDTISYRGLSINNLLSVTSGNWQSTADTAIAEATILINRLATIGVPVRVWGILGYGFVGWTSDPSNGDYIRSALQRVNAAIAIVCENIPNVYFLDPVSAAVQAADGRYVSDCQGFGSQDGIHPNGIAGYRMAVVDVAVLESIFGMSQPYYYSGNNFLTDPFFATTTTSNPNATGTTSTMLTFGVTGATITGCQIEYEDGQVIQSGIITFNNSTNNVQIKPNISAMLADVVANTGYYGYEFDYSIENISGNMLAVETLERLDILKTSNGRVTLDQSINGLISGQKYKAVSQLVQYQDSAASLSGSSNGLILQISQNSSLAATGQQYKFRLSLPKLIKTAA